MKQYNVDQLSVQIHPTRTDMGRAAADAGLDLLRTALKEQENVRVIFAAAPSQNEVVQALRDARNIDWGRVTAFHMDNYIGLGDDAPQQFSRFLGDRLFDHLPFGQVHLMGTETGEEERYAKLLAEAPIDLCFMGVGENGHIAFNDPGNAFFSDPETVKLVELDLPCRQQQVNEGNFQTLEDVPTHALTLTIPALMSARHLICTVPGENKAEAIRNMLEGAIEETCPASILRNHYSARLFLDEAAASKLRKD